MIRVYIIIPLVVLSYFGITFLVEKMNPEVKELSSRATITSPKRDSNGLSEEITGAFKIDLVASEAWLDSQENLDDDSKIYFSSLHANQTQFSFDGKSIWFNDQASDISVEVITNDGKNVELKMLEPSSDHKGSHTFFLQAQGDGGVWYSNYSHLEAGKKMLYRARYTKQVE